jgi:phosphoglycerol transferase MdoB-like AlkP superfamily enzyme
MNAVASEWTKLWTVRSSWLNIVAAVLLTTLLGTQYGFSLAYDNTHLQPGDLAENQAVGDFGSSVILIVQVVVAAFALLTVTSEYATGSIRSTLQWTPVRRTSDPISPTLSAMVLVAWAIGGLALGTRVLSRRDA